MCQMLCQVQSRSSTTSATHDDSVLAMLEVLSLVHPGKLGSPEWRLDRITQFLIASLDELKTELPGRQNNDSQLTLQFALCIRSIMLAWLVIHELPRIAIQALLL